jgi:hypothetical protein
MERGEVVWAKRTQRVHRSVAEKRRIVELVLRPGVTVARVAQAEGVNANQVPSQAQTCSSKAAICATSGDVDISCRKPEKTVLSLGRMMLKRKNAFSKSPLCCEDRKIVSDEPVTWKE